MSDNQNLPTSYSPQVPLPQPLGGYPGGDESAPGSAQLRRYLAGVLRFKWIVLALVVAGTVGALYMSRNVPRVYTADATLYFEGSDAQLRGPIQSSELLKNDGWVSLLRSYAVLDQVVLDRKLYIQHSWRDASVFDGFRVDSSLWGGSYQLVVDPSGSTVTLQTSEGQVLEQTRPGEAIGVERGFIWQPAAGELTAGRVIEFNVASPRQVAAGIRSNMQARMGQNNSFLTLQYSGTNPQHVVDVVNAITERYVEVAAELKRGRVSELREVLEIQLASAQEALVAAESQLQNYQVQTITRPTEYSTPIVPGLEATRAPALTNYFQLSIEREQLQRDRQAIQRALAARSENPLSVDGLSAIPSVGSSPELSQALGELTVKRAELRATRQIYTTEHDDVKRATADLEQLERTVIPTLAARLISELEARSSTLNGLIASASGELREIPTRAIDEARLTRSVRMQEALYNDLRQQYEKARLGEETASADVRIFDSASGANSSTADPRMRFAMLGFAGSLGLGLLLAIVLDRVDPRVRYAEQITDEMHLSIIGAIPTVPGSRAGVALDNAEVVEAFRGIRLNMMYAYGTAGPLMVTISSPGSGDGKTFISSNIALAFADLGMKTLLIDGDTRRGQQHRLFGLERRPGLVDYLAGNISADAAIQATQFPNVDVMTSGTRRSDSPELLQSPMMSELLARIKTEYQVILVDSPPLGAGVDPLLLASLTGNMMLVLRTGTTDRQLAEAKLQMLDRLPIRILGAVFNGVRQGDAYRYYSYLPGYESGADAVEQKVLEPANG
jgi:polysaccharide biosynthesis transport protein